MTELAETSRMMGRDRTSAALSLPNANADKFLVGRNNWLFLNNDSNNVIAQVTGNLAFNAGDLRAWRILLDLRRAWAESRGARYAFIIAPNKECVYSEMLPDGLSVSESRPVRHLLADLDEYRSVRPIYPIDALIAAKETRHTYPMGDTHWNWYGAWLAYLELAKNLNLTPINEDQVVFYDAQRPGDLSEKLGHADLVTRAKIRNNKASLVSNNKIAAHGNLLVFENEDRSLPRAVLFRDSFSAQLTDYLSQHFSRLVAVWQPHFDFSILNEEKPDIIISEQAERFLIRVPDDLRGATNADYVARKRKA